MDNQGCNEFVIQDTAARLFQTAALLVGNEAEAVSLVEETLSGVEVDPCADGASAQVLVQDKLVQEAIRRLGQREPGSFALPVGSSAAGSSCIEDDDISAAGISAEQLEYLLEGEGRGQLRSWLERLPAAQRVVFVERAVLRQDNAATAGTLQASGGEGTSNWTPGQVSDVFRQALCSLATSLVHSGQPVPAV